MVEDYLNIIDNFITIAAILEAEVDQKIEEVPTDFIDGSIPFADTNLLVEDNDNFYYNSALKKLGIGTNSPDANLQVNILNAATIGIIIKAASSQTERLMSVRNNSDSAVFEITDTGHITNKNGIRTTSNEYGAGLATQNYGEDVPEHTNQFGWYDHTGGAEGENLFTKTSGDDFTQADADNGNWIVFITGDVPGAFCEIKEFISATKVIVDGMGWDQDINSSISPGSFYTVKHPGFITGDGNKHEFSVGSEGEFEVVSYDFTGRYMAEFELDSAADGTDCVLLKAEANGYNNVQALVIDFISGALDVGDRCGGISVKIDVSEATAADSTTNVSGLTVELTNGSSATTNGITVFPGFSNALAVSGAEEEDPGYGYEITSGVVADRVNGGTADTTAFLNSSASNLDLFDSDNDYILIGSDNTFEIIDVTLTSGSGKDIAATYEYSTGSGTWSTLTITSDSTNGFQQSGIIFFDAPVGWAKGDEAEAPADITSAYYVRITRTYTPTIPSLPNENYFKTFQNKSIGMRIRGDGSIQPVTNADANMPNDSIYYSTDSSALVYKDTLGVVNDLY